MSPFGLIDIIRRVTGVQAQETIKVSPAVIDLVDNARASYESMRSLFRPRLEEMRDGIPNANGELLSVEDFSNSIKDHADTFVAQHPHSENDTTLVELNDLPVRERYRRYRDILQQGLDPQQQLALDAFYTALVRRVGQYCMSKDICDEDAVERMLDLALFCDVLPEGIQGFAQVLFWSKSTHTSFRGVADSYLHWRQAMRKDSESSLKAAGQFVEAAGAKVKLATRTLDDSGAFVDSHTHVDPEVEGTMAEWDKMRAEQTDVDQSTELPKPEDKTLE